MEDGSPSRRDLSLIPYPSESRDIVLRHGSAVVVYDQRSKQLTLSDPSASHAVELADCPYCHRPLVKSSPGHERSEHGSSPSAEQGFVSPEYFRMLAHSTPASAQSSRPPSPRRRLQSSSLLGTSPPPPPFQGEEHITSSRASPQSSNSISASAFSHGYYKRFFVEQRELGKGGKGVVMLVTHVLDGVTLGQYACKRVPVGDDHEWLEKVLLEVQLLQSLSHQNLVSYRHVWLEDWKISSFSPSVPCAFILQQYCNSGDLHKYILNMSQAASVEQDPKEVLRRKSRGQLEPPKDLRLPRHMLFEEIFTFFKDITSGLHHLHTNGYIHRDLKPSNCLLHKAGTRTRVLVSDFGEVQMTNVARKSTGATGTISYCAPEVLKQEEGGRFGDFSTKSDIFSLGMIVYFMCFGHLPYLNADGIDEDNEDVDQLRQEIATWAGFDDRQIIRSDLPDKLYKFLKRLLSTDPTERPGTEEILHGIKTGSGIGDIASVNQGPHSPILEDVRTRFSSAESSSPAPQVIKTNKREGSIARPLLSAFRPRSSENGHANNNVPNDDRDDSVEMQRSNSSIVLSTRKVHMPSPTFPMRQPSRLMPPPALPQSVAARIRRQLNAVTLANVGRIVLFLVKIYSVSSPCAPYAPNSWIGSPLLGLAVLDLTLTGFARHRREASAVLAVAHLLTVAIAHRWGFLCARRAEDWEAQFKL